MASLGSNGYVPIGIDIKVEAAQAAKRVLAQLGIQGYAVAADLRRLPFKDGVFDRVFSYSVLQHAHRAKTLECIHDIHRVLKTNGFCMLEFPTRYGIGNSIRFVSTRRRDEEDDAASWCVRYYRLSELKEMFVRVFGNAGIHPDCYFGIGVQASDIDILPLRYRPIVYASEWIKRIAVRIPFLQKMADSVFVVSNRTEPSSDNANIPPIPLKYHSNLDIIPLLSCPVSGTELRLDTTLGALVSDESALAYPIEDDIPILIPEFARKCS